MNTVPKIAAAFDKSKAKSNLVDELAGRNTEELVIAIAGAVGAGNDLVAELIAEQLTKKYGYNVTEIKVTRDLITKELRHSHSVQVPDEPEYERITKLQDFCDQLREKYERSAIAQLICAKIADSRAGSQGTEKKKKESVRNAYIVFSLKHPEEAKLLRNVYKRAFNLIAVETPEHIRKQRMTVKGITPVQFAKLSERDQKDVTNPAGQNVLDTMQLADFFLRNAQDNKDILSKKLSRYLSLLLDDSIITPTVHETSMYHAFAAARRSACLSRQVGAAVVGEGGEILSTGANDVPKFGGGLYTVDSTSDSRCFNKSGKCHNDAEKNEIYSEIAKALSEQNLIKKQSENQVKKLLGETKIKDLIEFSRAVHAEMEAIVSLARKPNSSSTDATMYVTTFPCHSCARHIVSAGIKTVYYIEPYAKSLATKLHDDAISTDETNQERVRFLPYEGIAPDRYLSLFGINTPRKIKGEGSLVKNDVKTTIPRERLPFDDFYEIELKVIQSAASKGLVKAEE